MKKYILKKHILDVVSSKSFRNLADSLENLLSETSFPPVDENEVYSQITDNYFKLIKKLKIKEFSTFSFNDYNDCRVVIIDGKKYDFDSLFSHNDSSASEYLCEIDALIADLGQGEEKVLKEIENKINNAL